MVLRTIGAYNHPDPEPTGSGSAPCSSHVTQRRASRGGVGWGTQLTGLLETRAPTSGHWCCHNGGGASLGRRRLPIARHSPSPFPRLLVRNRRLNERAALQRRLLLSRGGFHVLSVLVRSRLACRRPAFAVRRLDRMSIKRVSRVQQRAQCRPALFAMFIGLVAVAVVEAQVPRHAHTCGFGHPHQNARTECERLWVLTTPTALTVGRRYVHRDNVSGAIGHGLKSLTVAAAAKEATDRWVPGVVRAASELLGSRQRLVSEIANPIPNSWNFGIEI